MNGTLLLAADLNVVLRNGDAGRRDSAFEAMVFCLKNILLESFFEGDLTEISR